MKRKSGKEAWEVKSAKVVSSASFIELFENARRAMLDPQRKACSHPICAANGYVG
jgi:hypothetical protein